VVRTRFMRWSHKGVWERVFEVLSQDPDNEYTIIDSTIVRAHQHSAGAKGSSKDKEAIGWSSGGLSRKIHVVCDGLGKPAHVHLTPGQACDLDGADVLIGAIKADTLTAGKGYDADERVLDRLKAASIKPVIPPRSNRKSPRSYDRVLYKACHLIENFFEKLKQYRAITTRYDKTAAAFKAAIHLACSLIWLK